ncbi:hypothetical protein HNO92_004238 [Chromobacterium alkanivorans]|uniref:hypothetical protein n=1 Tax=Chromobacterium alkanivorans TaxID=1071719 RepID=UPI00216715FC|nr:hypothetical protein [Chromobacterium alkanivorans]MCS3806629.1 hypothetical protein [Chromobacterium alkanivorans]MCS3820967.1 hypothetical protein [Chromobacterium alkanivorans]MCS3875889.1 hypothetical protein [Chromobacterium alkanivorans]
MNTTEIRRHKLGLLIERDFDGTVSRLAELIDRRPPQIYRLFSDAPSGRGMGENLARHIETRLNLPRYWLDQEGDIDALPPLRDRVAEFEASLSERALLQLLIDDLHRGVRGQTLSRKALISLRGMVEALAQERRPVLDALPPDLWAGDAAE